MFCPKSKLFVILVACSALATTALPAVAADYVTLIDNGASDNRVDVVFLGDGYTQADLSAGTYDQHINGYLEHMFGPAPSGIADPFPRYANFFNVHKIDVVSNESGADNPNENHYVDTALDASYYWDGTTERLLYLNSGKAQQALNAGLQGAGFFAEMKLVTINDTTYGGAGGTFATFAGGNPSAQEIALHELGHSFSDLADEYGGGGNYPGGEPFEINVTTDPAGGKWSQWIGYTDPRDSDLDIGVFEGGRYYNLGIYRPSFDSKMRTLNTAFNAVAREQMILDLYDHVDPLDGWLDNTVGAVGNDAVWVDVIDPSVIAVRWFVDGELVEGATGTSIDLEALGYAPGQYTVTAHAYDTVIDHAHSGDLLDLVRRDFDQLEQDINWNATVLIAGDSNGDGEVGLLDMGNVGLNFGKTGDWSMGDFDGDGLVSVADLDLVGNNFGKTGPQLADGFDPGSGNPGGGGGGGGDPPVFPPTIPEPASLALLLISTPAILRRRS